MPVAAVLRALALAVVLFLPVAVFAGWFDKFTTAAEKAGSRVAAGSAGTLEKAARHVKSLPAKTDGVALAAQATQEGHWRFVNRAGEMFTAGTPDEMKRAVSVLHPEAKAGVRLSLYVTDDTIFSYRAALKTLPADAELFVVHGSESYRVLRRVDGTVERFFAEVRPNLVIEMSDRRLFEEAAWQLARPLDKASVRVLALEPGGPSTLSAWPRIDKASKRALIDVIDPGEPACGHGFGAWPDAADYGAHRARAALRAALQRVGAKPAAQGSVQGCRGRGRQPDRAARPFDAAPAGRTQLAVADGGGQGAGRGHAARAHGRFPERAGRSEPPPCGRGPGPPTSARCSIWRMRRRSAGSGCRTAGQRPLLRHGLGYHRQGRHHGRAGQPAQCRATAGTRPACPARHPVVAAGRAIWR